MQAPDEIKRLVEKFNDHVDAYKSVTYGETQVRREFIDPLFKSLGWDVDNTQGWAETYKEVIHEDSVKIGGSTKAPDYSFRIGGVRKFFLEAKKPSVHIKNEPTPAYQVRRYAWSAKLPVSVLTDFEEFAVYDCRVKPEKTDKAAVARVMYLTYADYERKWDEIASIFSKEAVLKGSFDKFAESHKKKRGTAEVDDAFLAEIETWRDSLARNIALRNPALTQRELNFAVQKIIDRIIFLRICEDRGIEPTDRLRGLQNGDHVYERLCQFFTQADDRYNSGLFHFKSERGRDEPDELTLNLALDDKPLKEIFRHLYYPDSPYEFSVLPADILGQVYEQFLGKVIRLTAGHQAKVEYKPEVKKAGGVYYTPTYIVDYIVENTVGKLCAGKTPKQVEKLRILDPACGSGSFLLGAYQYLLDWHLEYYVKRGPEKHKKVVYQAHGGEWRLTTAERKRILLNNIFGVDIDSQAVETTKLSLLLKVLEGEDKETINRQLRIHHERALPDLGSNIKCGNSLIGPDFYEGAQMTMLDDEERYRINVFDWDAEFPAIMKDGGFDAVIGNPPYSYQIPVLQQEYFSKQYQHQDYQKDLYLLFLERYAYFLRLNGLLGVIVSNTWTQSVTLRKIRELLTWQYAWQRILHLKEKVFRAVVDTHVLIFKRTDHSNEEGNLDVDIRSNGRISFWHRLPWKEIPKNGDPINVVVNVESQNVFREIRRRATTLNDICSVFNGLKPFEKGKGTPPQTEKVLREKPYVKEGEKPGQSWSPLLRGSLINRYKNLWNYDYWVKYGPWLAAPRDPKIFEAPEKIVVRQTGDSIIALLIDRAFYARDNLHIILSKNSEYALRYILGIINSSLIDFVYTLMNPEKGEALAQVKKHHVEHLPIRAIDFNKKSDKAAHDKMVSLVDAMLSLNKKLAVAKTDHDKKVLQRQIGATDKQIDNLVYDLYGLTEEEIRIVEERGKS